MAMHQADKVFGTLCELLPETEGFECHRFKVGSYNALVERDFKLCYDDNVMAAVVLNTPSFLETTFKNWLISQKGVDETVNDLIAKFGANPLQAYFTEKFRAVKKALLPFEAEVIQDFDFSKQWVPKVLLTTCGMVSGAAYYYRPSPGQDLLIVDPISHVKKRRMGLSLHPKFGGHFGFRAVFIFKDIELAHEFKERQAPMILDTIEKQEEALNLFNYHWLDGRFRDCGDPIERYSELQMKFFSTAPIRRWSLIEHWFNEKIIMEKYEKILERLHEEVAEKDGLELHIFKVGSYNSLASSYFQLPYDENAMAVLVLNTPSFFETTFKSWLKSQQKSGETLKDLIEKFGSSPIRAYFSEKFDNLKRSFIPVEVVVLHDSDVQSNRRPVVLMTTCGHVSGAAFFYRPPEDALRWFDPETKKVKRRMGLSLHPKFGGHFAYRAVLIFPEIHLPADFQENRPVMRLDTIEKQNEAITLFNEHWKDVNSNNILTMEEKETCESAMNKLHEVFPDQEGFELHQFKIGSYNEVAGACFQLAYDENAMGVVVLNTPSFFETTFKKWIQAKHRPNERVEELAKRFPAGPISAYFNEKFDVVKELFSGSSLVAVHDFELLPNRRPKIMMTTSGHVSGAVFFYHPPEEAFGISNKALLTNKRRTGVCLHPKYGGYFAFRGVFVFPNVHLPADFKEKRAPMVLDTIEKQEEAIALFNHHWWDGKFRDCGNPVEKYSDLQLKYFSTMPEKRWSIIAHWFQ
ncbi:unnamed protein product [Anisakis simplex]|uniref:Cyanocobalamin reductase (cyanide-eliminating) n=1 Tax=Anisakis simplex TaxID=6269 RepID=A0A158PNH5_ANISI|nr:unnamed protein product [Anisakis simplex]